MTLLAQHKSEDWQFEGLTPFKYGLIYADPCWKYAMRSEKGYQKSPEAHYKTMSLEELKQLRVAHLAAKDCLLVMWSTWPHLQIALELMEFWGFEYKTAGVWIKRTINNKLAFGTGYIHRSSSEPYLIGTIGNPIIRSKSERNVIETRPCETNSLEATTDLTLIPDNFDALRREHSRKPVEMRELLERLCPDYFFCELFATEEWPPHDVWGDQIGKFEPNEFEPNQSEQPASNCSTGE